ncbi:MAG: exodeoxyribonuclease VII large subunit [Rhodospirillaceae bacterium]|jgi:exodeoxyribonuclease VII large subunit
MAKEQFQAESEGNLPILSVSEISLALKREVEEAFAYVRIRGEISGFKRAASGHMYMTLKDEDAVLDGVCWRGTAGRLSVTPEDGIEVVVTGRLTTYPARSKYQVVIDQMEMAGEGALLKLLEDRRKKLAGEGLFDEERKQKLPYLPEVIGVVTSPTGAVIRDILHRLADRFPRHVLLWPVLVQGKEAAEQVAAAIAGFNRFQANDPKLPRPDLIIVARGGGSLEDLWAFNEEAVVRAAAESVIPLISAVGHETDTTLIDFAADQRAPTPTAAAEMAVPVRLELLSEVAEEGSRLVSAVSRIVTERATHLENLSRGLPNLPCLIEEAVQRLDDWSERLENGLKAWIAQRQSRLAELSAGLLNPKPMIEQGARAVQSEGRALELAGKNFFKHRQDRLNNLAGLLESYSFERTLERGFALVKDEQDQLVRSVRDLTPGQVISVSLADGSAGATVTDNVPVSASSSTPSSKPPQASKMKSAKKKKPEPPEINDKQGTLL